MTTDFGEAPNARTLRDLTAIAEAEEGVARERLVSDFIAARNLLFSNYAKRILRRYRIGSSHEEDVIQLVRMVAFELVASGNWDRWLKSNRVFERDVYVTASSAVRDEYDSAAQTPVSGVTSKIRRGRSIAEVRVRLRDAMGGAEPTRTQIIATHNEEVTARRSDAARQGMIIDDSDFETVRAVPIEDHHHGHLDTGAEDMMIAAVEGRELITQTIAVAHERAANGSHKMLGRVAQAWVGGAFADPPYILSNAEVATEVGISYEISRQLLNQCRQIAAEIAVTRYGYSTPDAPPRSSVARAGQR